MILYKKAQRGTNTWDNPEYAAMSKVVNQRNKDNPWIKRAFEDNPPGIINDDGTESSHRLSAEVDAEGNWMVFPNIVRLDNGQLREMGTWEAMDYAKKNKTVLNMPNREFALYYAKNGLIKH